MRNWNGFDDGFDDMEAIVIERHLVLGAFIRKAAVIGAMLAGLVCAAPAFADVIDGDWCHDDGRHFSIQGPTIVTPAGKQTQGQYTRHTFRYTVPADDPASGQDISMQLLNELTLSLRAGADGASQIWHRCKPTTS